MCAFLPLNYLDSRHNVSPTFHFSACMCLEVYQFFKSAWIGEERRRWWKHVLAVCRSHRAECWNGASSSSGTQFFMLADCIWMRKSFFFFCAEKRRNCHIIFSRSPRPFIASTATTFLGWTIMYVRLLNFYGTFFSDYVWPSERECMTSSCNSPLLHFAL